MRNHIPYMWVSFVDINQTPHKHLGVVLVRAKNLLEAAIIIHGLGIHPGGHILGQHLPKHVESQIPDSAKRKLLTREQLEELFPDWGVASVREIKAKEAQGER